MRAAAVAISCALLSGSAQAIEPPPSPRPQAVAKQAIQKSSLLKSAASAAVGQIANRPREWGRGVGGFGKRFASSVGGRMVKSTVQMSVAAFRHEDLKYYPSEQQGFGPRVKHALVSTVVARKTTNGRQTLASGRISGAVAGGFVSRLWQPARLHTVSSGLSSSGISLGADAASNVVREFWPEIRHPRRRR
jgi:hypothetical protein